MNHATDRHMRGPQYGPCPQLGFLTKEVIPISATRLQISCCWNLYCLLSFASGDTESFLKSSVGTHHLNVSIILWCVVQMGMDDWLLACFFTRFNKRLPWFLIKRWWEQRPAKSVHKNYYQKLFQSYFISAKASTSQKFSTFLGVLLFFIKTRKWDNLICNFVKELKNVHSSFPRLMLKICARINVWGFFFFLTYLFGWRKNISTESHPFPPFQFFPERWKALLGCNSTTAVLPTWKIIMATNLWWETN